MVAVAGTAAPRRPVALAAIGPVGKAVSLRRRRRAAPWSLGGHVTGRVGGDGCRVRCGDGRLGRSRRHHIAGVFDLWSLGGHVTGRVGGDGCRVRCGDGRLGRSRRHHIAGVFDLWSLGSHVTGRVGGDGRLRRSRRHHIAGVVLMLHIAGVFDLWPLGGHVTCRVGGDGCRVRCDIVTETVNGGHQQDAGQQEQVRLHDDRRSNGTVWMDTIQG